MSGTRRKPGPLGPFVEGYRDRLLELGYSPLSVTRSLIVLGHLGRWMDRGEFAVDDLGGEVLKTFLAACLRDHGHLPSAGVMHCSSICAARDCRVRARAAARAA